MDNNRLVVDKAVGILTNLYREILKKHGVRNNVDFSGLSELIMTQIEQGKPENIGLVISKYVDEKIQAFDKTAGQLEQKANFQSKHRAIVDDLIGFSKKWNSQCTDGIVRNITVKNTKENTFKEELSDMVNTDVLIDKKVAPSEEITQEVVTHNQLEKTEDNIEI